MKGSGISVVIPAYNRAGLIGLTLESLLKQTLPAEEILVVDDGSTDRTVEVAEGFGGPVRVIEQANAGPGAARNRGFEESKGEFIHFFDSDDIAVVNKHEVQRKALEESGGDIAYGPWIKGRFAGRTFHAEGPVMQQGGLPEGSLIQALLENWSTVPHACLFRRSLVEKAGGFPEDMRIAEDQMMFLNCLLAGAKVVHSPGTLELYRNDNADKLTANSDAERRRVVDWAKFLDRALREVESAGHSPLKWIPFRRRYWQAMEDLRNYRDADAEELRGSMAERLGTGAMGALIYKMDQWMGRKTSGLKERTVGHRHGAVFRIGELTKQEEDLIEESGYRVGNY